MIRYMCELCVGKVCCLFKSSFRLLIVGQFSIGIDTIHRLNVTRSCLSTTHRNHTMLNKIMLPSLAVTRVFTIQHFEWTPYDMCSPTEIADSPHSQRSPITYHTHVHDCRGGNGFPVDVPGTLMFSRRRCVR